MELTTKRNYSAIGTTKQKPCEDGCPFRTIMNRLGDKWSVLIILILDEQPMLRFTELRDRIDGISLKVLASCLKKLEKDSLVTRTSYDTVPPRVEYSLSAVGKKLVPFIRQLSVWAMKNL